jgi:membrane-associated protease RseP (regulator of RpoE activity)
MSDPADNEPSGGSGVPASTESGPPPGGFLAAADRLSQSIAGGYGWQNPSGDGAADAAARRRALLRLLAATVGITVCAVALQVSTGLPLFTVEAIVAVLIVVIMLHELGHLLVAKKCGIKVTEYFVGFGPKLWSIRRGETEYGIKPVLLGGYVRIIGMNNLEEVAAPDEPRTYRQQAWFKRAAVSLAGPAVHFVIAFLLLVIVYGVVGATTVESRVAAVDTLANGDRSPAQAAGFQVGDGIVSVDGRSAKDWNAVVGYIQSKPGVQLTVVVLRAGRLVTLTPTPADESKIVFKDANGKALPPVAGSQPIGLIGLEPRLINSRVAPLPALGRSFGALGRGLSETVVGLGRIFSPHGLTNLGQQVVSSHHGTSGPAGTTAAGQRPVSVIGIGRLATQAAHDGLNSVLALIVLLNLFLGVFNLIPLLPFDGGHVAIAVYERLRSRHGQAYRADVAKMLPVTYALLLVVAFLGISTVYLDLAHPVANPFR